MVEALADAMDDRGFQSIVMQNVFVDEGRELRLAAHDIFRFAADARPDRIDLVEGPCGPSSDIEPWTYVLPATLGIPYLGLLAQFCRCEDGHCHSATAHGSSALAKEVDNAGFEYLVADRQHVIAVRDIERLCARNERGQFLRQNPRR